MDERYPGTLKPGDEGLLAMSSTPADRSDDRTGAAVAACRL
jgi:hypothetical protein